MLKRNQSRKIYPSDVTDEQWALVAPLLPPAKSNPRGGRPRQVDLREILNTMRYLHRSGCQWDMLPHDLVPGAIVTPLSKVVIGRTLREKIVGEHIPLTPTPMEISHRVEDFSHLDLARAPAALAWLGGGEQRLHQGPLLVREIGWISLSGLVCFDHCCALLCSWDMR